jgi:hypothetical protein
MGWLAGQGSLNPEAHYLLTYVSGIPSCPIVKMPLVISTRLGVHFQRVPLTDGTPLP